MAHKLTISNAGIKLIKDHEGLNLVAFKDPLGEWVIGWGHTRGISAGDFINREIATTLLLEDIQEAERCLHNNVKVPLNQNMYDALISLVFDIKCHKFKESRLLELLNRGEYLAAADEFKSYIRANGIEQPGLVRRRALEQGLYLSELNLLHNFVVVNPDEEPFYVR